MTHCIVVQVMLANILGACFLYNAGRVLGLLASAEVLAPVLAGWFDALPLIITDTSNKLAGAGISALLRLGPSALPAALSVRCCTMRGGGGGVCVDATRACAVRMLTLTVAQPPQGNLTALLQAALLRLRKLHPSTSLGAGSVGGGCLSVVRAYVGGSRLAVHWCAADEDEDTDDGACRAVCVCVCVLLPPFAHFTPKPRLRLLPVCPQTRTMRRTQTTR